MCDSVTAETEEEGGVGGWVQLIRYLWYLASIGSFFVVVERAILNTVLYIFYCI